MDRSNFTCRSPNLMALITRVTIVTHESHWTHTMSSAPILSFDERFARQYRFELPSEFPVTSPYPSIVHHLSGPNNHAFAQSLLRRSGLAGAAIAFAPYTHFRYAYEFSTRRLAWVLDSLVRVQDGPVAVVSAKPFSNPSCNSTALLRDSFRVFLEFPSVDLHRFALSTENVPHRPE